MHVRVLSWFNNMHHASHIDSTLLFSSWSLGVLEMGMVATMHIYCTYAHTNLYAQRTFIARSLHSTAQHSIYHQGTIGIPVAPSCQSYDTIPRYHDTTIPSYGHIEPNELEPRLNRANRASSTKHSIVCIYYVLYVYVLYIPTGRDYLRVQAFISRGRYVHTARYIQVVCTVCTVCTYR